MVKISNTCVHLSLYDGKSQHWISSYSHVHLLARSCPGEKPRESDRLGGEEHQRVKEGGGLVPARRPWRKSKATRSLTCLPCVRAGCVRALFCGRALRFPFPAWPALSQAASIVSRQGRVDPPRTPGFLVPLLPRAGGNRLLVGGFPGRVTTTWLISVY